MNEWARGEGFAGLGYATRKGGEWGGPIAKNHGPEKMDALADTIGIGPDDGLFFAAGKEADAARLAGFARTRVAEQLDLIEKDAFRFCWIVDFPMYEYNEEQKKIDFSHNPFSMPQGGMEALESKDPLEILAWQYDIVCNGVELSSGAIRNHRPDIMYKAFEIAGYTKEEVDRDFSGMINAFKFGAPPHGGSAPGIDRIVMLLADEPNIREVILFPMNQKAEDLMMNAPSEVMAKQLQELHIRVVGRCQLGPNSGRKSCGKLRVLRPEVDFGPDNAGRVGTQAALAALPSCSCRRSRTAAARSFSSKARRRGQEAALARCGVRPAPCVRELRPREPRRPLARALLAQLPAGRRRSSAAGTALDDRVADELLVARVDEAQQRDTARARELFDVCRCAARERCEPRARARGRMPRDDRHHLEPRSVARGQRRHSASAPIRPTRAVSGALSRRRRHRFVVADEATHASPSPDSATLVAEATGRVLRRHADRRTFAALHDLRTRCARRRSISRRRFLP